MQSNTGTNPIFARIGFCRRVRQREERGNTMDHRQKSEKGKGRTQGALMESKKVAGKGQR